MSRRVSFHISDDADAIVAENSDQAKRINFLICACAELMESPKLSEQEWMVIVAAANGFSPRYQDGVESVLHSFATDIPYAAIFGSEYEGIDKEELAQKYWALPLKQRLFVFEISRKFWLPKDSPIASYKEWLTENGAKII